MKNKKLVLTIVGVATLLIAVVGATFAFFASTMNNGTKNITVGTATVSNVQLTNEMIGMSDILPGYESAAYNITASATITGEFTVPYTCKISQSSESLVDLEYLVVAGSGMSSTVNNTWTSVPTSATTFLTGSLSQLSLSQTSTIKFRLHETGTNQTSGQSGVNSTVTVTCTLDGGGSLYYNNNSSGSGTTTMPEADSDVQTLYTIWSDDWSGEGYVGQTIPNDMPTFTDPNDAIEQLFINYNNEFVDFEEDYSLSEVVDAVPIPFIELSVEGGVITSYNIVISISEGFANNNTGIAAGLHRLEMAAASSNTLSKNYNVIETAFSNSNCDSTSKSCSFQFELLSGGYNYNETFVIELSDDSIYVWVPFPGGMYIRILSDNISWDDKPNPFYISVQG